MVAAASATSANSVCVLYWGSNAPSLQARPVVSWVGAGEYPAQREWSSGWDWAKGPCWAWGTRHPGLGSPHFTLKQKNKQHWQLTRLTKVRGLEGNDGDFTSLNGS